MRLFLALLIVTFSTLVLAQSEKRDGYWWTGIEKHFEGGNPEVSELIAKFMRIAYVTGVLDRSAEEENLYHLQFGFDTSYIQYQAYKTIWEHYSAATIGQYVQGVSKIYEDYRNLQIRLVDAIYVVGMEVKGEAQEQIELQLRDFRAGENVLNGVYKRLDEKWGKEKLRKGKKNK